MILLTHFVTEVGFFMLKYYFLDNYMKIAFIDFDGPIFNDKSLDLPENTIPALNKASQIGLHPFYNYWKMHEIERQMLLTLIEKGYLFVVTSSWSNPGMHSKEQIQQLFVENNIPAVFHSDWTLDHNKDLRSTQILQWLNRHPEVKKYLILDDPQSGEGLIVAKAQGTLENVYLCDPDIGFVPEQLERIFNS